jgi:hypothetical protein
MAMDMKDSERMSKLTYQQRAELFKDLFSLGFINSDINEKLALIALIGYTVMKLREKKPDVSYYQVVRKLAEGTGLHEELIWAIAIIAEDFSYGCKDFPKFGLEEKQIVPKIKDIMRKYMPF